MEIWQANQPPADFMVKKIQGEGEEGGVEERRRGTEIHSGIAAGD